LATRFLKTSLGSASVAHPARHLYEPIVKHEINVIYLIIRKSHPYTHLQEKRNITNNT
jgi:hypothetical protein